MSNSAHVPVARPPARPPTLPSDALAHRGRSRKRGNWRKTLFRLHGWLGLNVGLLLFVTCFSGSVATLSHEIDRLVNPAMRAATQDAPYAWTAMHETLAEAFPEGQNLGVHAPVEPGFAALAYVTVPNGQTRKVYLNPYTGALQGHTSFFNVQRFFRSFHRRFFDGQRGITIVTLSAFVLLLISITGFLFYKGWLKQLFTLRRDRGRRLLWSDLHKTTGIWGLAFTLLIALTGVFYFVEVVFTAADNYDVLLPPPLPAVDEASLATYGPQPDLLPADAYATAAKAVFPELEIRSMRMPHQPGQPVYLDGQAGNPITRDRANKVLVHPFSAEVIAIQRSSDLGIVPFITDAVDPLHFGYFGGLGTKVLWCVLGLVLSFSILAGTYLWVVRSKPVTRRRRNGQAQIDQDTRSFPWLRGTTVAFALTLAYFVVVVFTTVQGIRAYSPSAPPPVAVTETVVGPYQVRVDCDAPCRVAEGATYTARFLGMGLPNYQQATLGASATTAAELTGPSYAPRARVQVPPGQSLRLVVTMWDGTVHEASFRAPSAAPARAPLPTLPDTAPGVWVVVGLFVMLTMGFIGAWFYCIIRVVHLQHRHP